MDIFGDGQDLRAKFSDLMGEVVNKTGVIGGNRKVTSNVAGGMDPEMILISSTGGNGMRFQSYKFLDLSESTDTNNAQKALALGKPLSGSSAALFVQSGDSWAPMEITAFNPWVRSERPVSGAKKVNARGEILTDEGIVRNGVLRRFSDLTSKWVIEPGQEIDLNRKGMILATGVSTDGGGTAVILLVPIEITFESVGNNDNISDNKKIRSNSDQMMSYLEWMPGKGKRIFPDAKEPNGSARDTFNVRAEVGIPNLNIYLALLDVDDPTKDPQFIVDDNDKYVPTQGDDNRGSVSTKYLSGTTDSAGTVRSGGNLPNFHVSMRAGDNYRVAVGLESTEVSALQTKQATQPTTYAPCSERQVREFSGSLSSVLTVWRKLNVEVDYMQKWTDPKPAPDRTTASATGAWTMGAHQATINTTPLPQGNDFYKDGYILNGSGKITIRNNTTSTITVTWLDLNPPSYLNSFQTGQFEVYDDDGDGLNAPQLPSSLAITDAVKESYSAAYIDIEEVPPSLNTHPAIPYESNSDISASLILDSSQDMAGSSKTEYWYHLLVVAYQGGEDVDRDGLQNGIVESVLLGITKDHDNNPLSSVYVEVIREVYSFGSNIEKRIQRKKDEVVAHEIGHVPGGHITWWDEWWDHGEGGIMAESCGENTLEFSPKTIKRFREAADWQQ